ncbi:MAG: ion channel [Candidatus Dojkabacteria bacterium]|nr:ion channel [Candidatus Dojkabacteria bacterium]MDQ7020266.1 ion channel [Candidatus Dojkabacteria bacterium]
MINRLFRSKYFFYRALAIMVILSLLAAVLTFFFERKVNEDMNEISEIAFWWVASITTVGSGGHPITDMGRFFGIFTMLFGSLFYLGAFTELIIWLKNIAKERFSGVKEYRGTNHILVLGYNSLAIGLITFLKKALKDEIDIVLITSTIHSNPYPDRVKFIKQSPISSSTLEIANANQASVAFVLSQDDVSDQKSDLNALLIGGMIEEMQKNVFTLVEISDSKNKEQMDKFKIDDEFTFLELLEDSRNEPSHSKILKKIPHALKESIIKQEYLKSTVSKIADALK